jgi:hypothetical protein
MVVRTSLNTTDGRAKLPVRGTGPLRHRDPVVPSSRHRLAPRIHRQRVVQSAMRVAPRCGANGWPPCGRLSKLFLTVWSILLDWRQNTPMKYAASIPDCLRGWPCITFASGPIERWEGPPCNLQTCSRGSERVVKASLIQNKRFIHPTPLSPL